MTAFFKLFIGFCGNIVLQLDNLRFDFFGHEVSFFGICVVFLIMGFIINVFWKGARA